jgi:N-acyl-D-amino-acid deacylase
MSRIVLRGGTVVDGTGGPQSMADVAVTGGRISGVGRIEPWTDDVLIDCTGRMVLPGLIDAHSHADAAVFDPEVALALLRQGVTTIVTGQDGVSFAPGSGRYATEYFAASNGSHPTYAGGGIRALLAAYDHQIPLNVGYLVPHGTVRYEVMGSADRPPTASELNRMTELIGVGLDEGALGLSTGLDYAPGYFADTAELIAVSEPVGRAGAIFVSHMRGGYEDDLGSGISELVEIAVGAQVPVHISHLHGSGASIFEAMAAAATAGADLSFDAYPYRRGCTLLAMPMVPPELLRLGATAAAERLHDPRLRAAIVRDHLPVMLSRPDIGPGWAADITFAGIGAPEYNWAEGLTIAEAGSRSGADPADFALRVMAASRLEVSAVLRVPHRRPIDELGRVFSHPAHVGSSDGIYLGGHPHPRGWGTFARFLGRHTRERGDYSWPQAVLHLASRTAARHGLGDRGRLAPGYVADVIVVDPDRVADTADYAEPRSPAEGIDDVLVDGMQVLAGGRSTGALPGKGLRRNAVVGRMPTGSERMQE